MTIAVDTPVAPAVPMPMPTAPKTVVEKPPTKPRNVVADHSFLVGEAVLAAGSVAHLADTAPWWFLVGGGLAAATVGAAVNNRWRDRTSTAFAGWVCVASGTVAGAATEWGVGSGHTIGATAAAAATCVPAYAWLRTRAEKRVAEQVAIRNEIIAARKAHVWESIMSAAGAKDVHVDTNLNDEEWTNGERKFPAGFALALTLGEKAPTARDLPAYVPAIEKIAATRLRLPIRTGSIEMRTREGYANLAEIVIPIKDLLLHDIPFDPYQESRSINSPLALAVGVDGSDLTLSLVDNPHGFGAGKTGKGKSNLLQLLGIRMTACEDAEVAMICGNKPSRNFAAWMLPFLRGTPDVQSPTGFVEPVLDWIAGSIEEACKVLLDTYKLMTIRQESGTDGEDKFQVRPGHPRWIVLIDESADFLQNTTYKVKPHDWTGPTWEDDEERGIVTGLTFSELMMKVLRLGRSEAINVYFLIQRPTVTMIGPDGGDIKSQLTGRISVHQDGSIEQNGTFNNANATTDVATLRIGEIYAEFADFEQPVKAKVPRVTKENIKEAAIRNHRYRTGLEPESAAQLDWYSGRWTRACQQDLLLRICRDAVRMIPGVIPASGSIAAPDDVDPGVDVAWDDLDAEQQVASLNEMFRSSPDGDELDDVKPDEGVEPVQPRADYSDPLPTTTRELFHVLDQSTLLAELWVTTGDVVALMNAHADWPAGSPGCKAVIKALNHVGVTQPRARPKRDGERLGKGFWAKDILAAMDAVRNPDRTDVDE